MQSIWKFYLERKMTTQIDLKEIERRAFRATYQDGLWDIYYGLIVVFMAIFIYRPEDGYKPLNILLALAGFLFSYGLFMAGKKFITIPRLGLVKFGEIRKKRKSTMGIVLGVLVLCQAILIVITNFGWITPEFGEKINSFLGDRGIGLLVVASLASLIVGSGMIIIVYFSEFSRGYYIALLMSLAVFLMVFFNRPIIPILVGSVIIIPGIVLLVRFIRRYPRTTSESTYG